MRQPVRAQCSLAIITHNNVIRAMRACAANESTMARIAGSLHLSKLPWIASNVKLSRSHPTGSRGAVSRAAGSCLLIGSAN